MLINISGNLRINFDIIFIMGRPDISEFSVNINNTNTKFNSINVLINLKKLNLNQNYAPNICNSYKIIETNYYVEYFISNIETFGLNLKNEDDIITIYVSGILNPITLSPPYTYQTGTPITLNTTQSLNFVKKYLLLKNENLENNNIIDDELFEYIDVVNNINYLNLVNKFLVYDNVIILFQNTIDIYNSND